MRKSFRYKARLTRRQSEAAERQLALCRELYNAALEERREAWSRHGKSISFYAQSKQLPEIKKMRPEYREVDSQALENVLRRLDRAFEGFFRRIKAGQTPGYPRFKGRSRYRSITFRQAGWKLEGRRLRLRGIGNIKLFLSRSVEGDVKTVTLKRDRVGDWFVSFSCDNVPEKPLPETGRAVGVDLGLDAFLVTSDGERVENPRHLRKAEAELRRAHRIVSKRQRGGSNRRKAVRILARKHRKVRRARRDFLFKTALRLVERYDTIAIEDLNVSGMARSRLAKSVRDAAWAEFIAILHGKAEEAARTVIAVNPAGTSQACSGCGVEVRKNLKVRTHRCPDCGLVMCRDENAARNVLALAVQQRGRAGPAASGPRSKAAA